jgi:hypothetical protein
VSCYAQLVIVWSAAAAVRSPCRGKTDLDERRIALTVAKDDLVEAVSALKRWLEICADDVGEEPENSSTFVFPAPLGPTSTLRSPSGSEIFRRLRKLSTVRWSSRRSTFVTLVEGEAQSGEAASSMPSVVRA